LKQERGTKELSLDAFAKLSGVSKSMLSQIEGGESSPTVASLWNLTKVQNIDFSKLLDREVKKTCSINEIVHAENTPVIHNRLAMMRRGLSPRLLSSREVHALEKKFDADWNS
jgi:transcriptional regulator with XRE-family HTH domain